MNANLLGEDLYDYDVLTLEINDFFMGINKKSDV